MSRPPVCRFYQAGSCVNGDRCPFAHPTVRCREFCSGGRCHYGFNCHFWHDPSHARISFPLERKLCRFFLNGQCKYGDKCTFSHDLEGNTGSEMTLAEYKASMRSANLSFSVYRRSSNQGPTNSINSSETCVSSGVELNREPISRSVRVPMQRPDKHLLVGGTAKSEISRLQDIEIQRLLKMFTSDKLSEVDCSEGRLFYLRFSSTDPDWAYDVREVVLSICIPRMYPVDPLKITVLPKDFLPETLVKHLNTCIQSWISFKHKQIRQKNGTEMYMRPFLRWLDRNLEDLFTQGLRKYKAELLGECDSSLERSFTEKTKLRSTTPSPPGSTPSVVSKGACDTNYVEDCTSSIENLLLGEIFDSVSSSSESITSPESPVHFECHVQKQFKEVQSEKSEADKDFELDKNLLEELLKPSESEAPLKLKATQRLFLNDMHLFGKAGTAVHRRLAVNLHCTRCSLAFDWIFTLPHGSVPSPGHLRSAPPHSSTCARCRQSMNLVFQADLLHPFSNSSGSFQLEGCVADDVPPKLSEFMLTCIECNKATKFAGVEGGGRATKRCTTCHSLIGLAFSGLHLQMVNRPDERVTNAFHRSDNEKASLLSRKVRRAINQAQQQLIQDGVPLPDLGTCKHYRKSHRWLRFPCCGRAEPCDVCHDQSAVDGHEMEMATRMICGFCAKEQPFSNTKPCVRCGKALCGSRSAHWEGGKGCRNKVTMSRKDVKKYSQQNKTISRAKTKA